ncbi:probable inactive receptor kinase At4g23740 [Olea europaea var. sylvestris]|uniref:Probable inactive receptor kinase At4g23740 n=1 Tax=Olea europaea subsp. europaea TaxID=158383 RepID=A0A8S0U4T3_OLEEU|nr:probable inactive receptor kinase At4g23740 [Olea europaea var. sylvestris]XP_022878687.1 probable inactive receptor kinase At4g23740 [Olea europaea var. sylvestris]CAA3013794.1 probable inactive receptor kinase At4g23740 [Olea europaea subsp. europaea]
MGIKLFFEAIFLFGSLYMLARAEPIEDKHALLDFINNISHSRNLNWDERTSVCNNWTGVTCNHDNSRVIAVRLPGIGFRGHIPLNTLGRLSALQILSLRSNAFSGPFPTDLLELGNLTGLYLQFNNFQGPLPWNFSVWKNLNGLNLSNNGFNGSIPSSITNLTHLTALGLANNSLSGDIPDLNIPSLQLLDLSNNNLTGVVPRSLLRFPSSAFVGNKISPETSQPPVLPPTAQPKKHSSKFSESAILGIVIGSSALAFVLIALLLIVTNRKKADEKAIAVKSEKKEKSLKRTTSERHDTNGKLVFFEGCNLAFDLEDLFRASAEVLGKGTFGTTYKAALEDATTVAVKRLREVSIGRKDFEQQMEVVGNIRHENVAPLRSYYYSKDEKLMVYDFYDLGSVSVLLHAKRGEDRIPLDWETRMKIAIGVARGIAYIHLQNVGKLVHGNIKASNVFLNSQKYGCVSDLGLAPLMSPITPRIMRTAGYRAPEITDTRKVSQASDVYSYGVLLLELLTGKSPVHAVGGEEVIHLVRWVHSVVREEWTGEVFDVELLRYPNIEEEMVAMLQIGMSCVARMPEQRPKMANVVKMVEDIRSVNTDNQPSSETKWPGSTPSLIPPVAQIGSSSVS